MEILQLKYFFESAKNESFAKTAQKYMVPITSVSASVKRLESELNCKLFDRHSNRIILNENGKQLQNSLFKVFAELENAIESVCPDSTDTREIKILVRAMRTEITELIIEYNKLHPEISFKTFFDFNTSDFTTFDIIIDDDTKRHENRDFFEFYSQKIGLIASKNNHLAGKKLYLKDLCNEKFISTGEHTGTHKLLVDSCKKTGFIPEFVAHTNDLMCYNRYVEENIGIGVKRYGNKYNKSENIVFLDVVDFIARQTVYVFYDKHSDHGNLHRFLDFIKIKISDSDKNSTC